MAYEQLKTPNLDPYLSQGGVVLTDWLGWCLLYAQTAFGAGWAGTTAWDGWSNHVSFKHADRNLPSGVFVPIWFDGTWKGQRLGHVALYKDGKIWSSPISHKPYADTWTSIDQVEKNYNMTYVGWSEDIGGTRVARPINQQNQPSQGGDMAQNNLDTERQLDACILGRDGHDGRPDAMKGESDGDIQSSGRDKADLTVQFINSLYDSPEAQGYRKASNDALAERDALRKQVPSLQGQLATEQQKSAGLATNLNESQLNLADAKEQLKQAESLAQDDSKKIDDLTAQLKAANGTITQLKAEAEKPPAPSEPQTNNPPIDAPTPQIQITTTWVDALLRALGIKR